MLVKTATDIEERQITTYPYKGKPLPVKETYIRWLSQAGPKDSPEYGLRLFTLGPGGAIPIHNHQYYQTMYILNGGVSVTAYDRATDAPRVRRGAVPALPISVQCADVAAALFHTLA